MKIALNKTYITKDKTEFSPIKTRIGKDIGRMKNMLGMPAGSIMRELVTYIDKKGVEYKKSDLIKEIKIINK